MKDARGPRLIELAALFLKLGVIGFGGPAAHIALMEDEVIRRRGWLTREKFLDLLGATNLIPGPNSTEMAIYIGHLRAGFAGQMVAGSCFILPAMLIVMGCAWAYVRIGTLPQAGGLLYGVKPVVIAVVFQAIWGLTRTAAKTPMLVGLGLAILVLGALGVHELLLLLLAGILPAVWSAFQKRGAGVGSTTVGLLTAGWLTRANGAVTNSVASAAAAASTAAVAGATAVPFGIWPLFLFFLKVGAVLYGSGYVLLAFLRADLVERFHWLTEAQLLDAIAIGQVTPGPVFTTATFIGYLLGGMLGAFGATVAIFLPAFFFVAISGPLIPRLRASRWAAAFLDGVNVASLALMILVTAQLARVGIQDWLTLTLTMFSAVLLVLVRVNSAWLILAGATVGILSTLWR
jgi:chromate transporter